MQKIISYFVIVLATTLLFFVNACTDSPIDEEFGSISGFITDAQSGEPLRAVNITLTPSGLSAVSGSDGRYEFVDLKPNQYTIQASRTGYQTNTKVVNVPRGNSVSCDIPLSSNSEPSTSVSLAVSETSVDFGTDISSYSLSLNNTGNASVGFEIDYNCDWLSITPISGIISGGGSQSITLSVNRQLLDGDATTTIQIKNVNDESVITVTVSASGNNEDPIIVTSGLMAYYTFDDGTANDKSGNNVNAILYGNPQLPTTSDWGRYLVLNSTLQSQYLKIPYNLFYNKHSWSVSFWIKDFGSGCIFAAQNTDSCDFDFDDAPELWVYEWTYNTFWISYTDLGIEETEQADFFDFNCNNIQYDGNWHHIVLTATNIDYYNENYDRYAQSSLYIDGVLQGQLNYIYSDLAIINLCQQVVFGGDKEGCYSYSCDMKLDNIRFFNRVITADEVLSIFNAKQ